jgi:hypothetical protein
MKRRLLTHLLQVSATAQMRQVIELTLMLMVVGRRLSYCVFDLVQSVGKGFYAFAKRAASMVRGLKPRRSDRYGAWQSSTRILEQAIVLLRIRELVSCHLDYLLSLAYVAAAINRQWDNKKQI